MPKEKATDDAIPPELRDEAPAEVEAKQSGPKPPETVPLDEIRKYQAKVDAERKPLIAEAVAMIEEVLSEVPQGISVDQVLSKINRQRVKARSKAEA